MAIYYKDIILDKFDLYKIDFCLLLYHFYGYKHDNIDKINNWD